MISFEQVGVRYSGSATRALDGVTLTAPAGEITAVTGPNGSGKSTLVRALLRRVSLDQGRILIDGRDQFIMSPIEISRLVAVAQQREEPAFPMRVDEYVALGRYPHLGVWQSPSSVDALAVQTAIVRTGLEEFAGRPTDALSGGEWQRVRIARALAQGGQLLVLDEPTTFLDLSHEMSLFELLDELATDGMAVLIVSHQLNLVARFARNVVLLHHGRVAATGSPADVMQAPLLERVYEWPLVVSRDPAVGAPSLVPLRRKPARSQSAAMTTPTILP